MIDIIEEALETPGFYILAGLGVGAEVLGFILAKSMGWMPMPLWQLIIIMIGTIAASAFFATR